MSVSTTEKVEKKNTSSAATSISRVFNLRRSAYRDESQQSLGSSASLGSSRLGRNEKSRRKLYEPDDETRSYSTEITTKTSNTSIKTHEFEVEDGMERTHDDDNDNDDDDNTQMDEHNDNDHNGFRGGINETKILEKKASVRFSQDTIEEETPPTKTSVFHLPVDEIQKRLEDEDENKRSDFISDLIEDIIKWKAEMAQLKVEKTAELVIRRKKEKNLIKLAKELTSTRKIMKEKDEYADRLVMDQAKLNSQVELLHKELNATVRKSESASRTSNAEMMAYRDNLREHQRQAEQRIAELEAKHASQCESLRRQVLSTTLEVDQLRLQVARHEMSSSSGDGSKRSIRNGDASRPYRFEDYNARSATTKPTKRGGRVVSRLSRSAFAPKTMAAIILVAMVACVRHMNPSTAMIPYICGPSRPGTVLTSSISKDVVLDSPWFVPARMKPLAFPIICETEKSKRIRVEWIGDLNHKQLVVSEIRSDESSSSSLFDNVANVDFVVLWKRSADSVVINSRTIEVDSGKNGVDTVVLDAPWRV